MRPILVFLTLVSFACSSKAATDGTSVDTTATATDDVSSSDTAAGSDTATSDTLTSDTMTSDMASGTDATGDGSAACFGGPSGVCATCLKTNCNAEITACVGTNWQTAADPTAPCAGLYAGICKCQDAKAAADTNASCGPKDVLPSLPAACGTCFNTLGTCLSAKCATDCNG